LNENQFRKMMTQKKVLLDLIGSDGKSALRLSSQGNRFDFREELKCSKAKRNSYLNRTNWTGIWIALIIIEAAIAVNLWTMQKKLSIMM
jgi:hypothetical protein